MPLIDIATGRVIEEVRIRPEIWDINYPYYKSKQARQAAWQQIFCSLVPDFQKLTRNEQRDVDRAIQQRWKTARDAYMRTKAVLKSGNTAKKYFYYNHCKFLDKNGVEWYESKQSKEADESTLQKRCKENNTLQAQSSSSSFTATPVSPSPDESPTSIDPDDADVTAISTSVKVEPYSLEEDIETVEDKHNKKTNSSQLLHTELDIPDDEVFDNVSENDVVPSSTRKTTKRRPKNLDLEICKILKETTAETQLNNDNMFFFMSLLPIVNKFSDRQKLLFRSEVLKVVMELSSTDN